MKFFMKQSSECATPKMKVKKEEPKDKKVVKQAGILDSASKMGSELWGATKALPKNIKGATMIKGLGPEIAKGLAIPAAGVVAAGGAGMMMSNKDKQ